MRKRPPIFVGIDPGASGGVVWYFQDYSRVVTAKVDTKDPAAVMAALPLAFKDRIAAVGLERVTVNPVWSRVACGSLLKAQGVALGVCSALGLPVYEVGPKAWQAVCFVSEDVPSDHAVRKGRVVDLACAEFKVRVSSGEADALWIAKAVELKVGNCNG